MNKVALAKIMHSIESILYFESCECGFKVTCSLCGELNIEHLDGSHPLCRKCFYHFKDKGHKLTLDLFYIDEN